MEAARAQAKYQAAGEPTGRFLDLIRACLVSGRAHLAGREGTEPIRSPESWGWRRERGAWEPLGECIGWIDDEDLYLEPGAAYLCVQTAGRDMGEALAVSEQTLKKRLREKGLLASTDEKRETLTVRRTLAGSKRDVLHFSRRTVLSEEPE